MVGHPYVGVDAQAMPECGVDQGIAEALIVCLGGEDDLAVVATLDDVLGLAGDDVAGESGHEGVRRGGGYTA